jgi:hypothetical protein
VGWYKKRISYKSLCKYEPKYIQIEHLFVWFKLCLSVRKSKKRLQQTVQRHFVCEPMPSPCDPFWIFEPINSYHDIQQQPILNLSQGSTCPNWIPDTKDEIYNVIPDPWWTKYKSKWINGLLWGVKLSHLMSVFVTFMVMWCQKQSKRTSEEIVRTCGRHCHDYSFRWNTDECPA